MRSCKTSRRKLPPKRVKSLHSQVSNRLHLKNLLKLERMRRQKIRYLKGGLSREQVVGKSGKPSPNQENLGLGGSKKKSNQGQKPSRQRNIQGKMICNSPALSQWETKMRGHLITYSLERLWANKILSMQDLKRSLVRGLRLAKRDF